ncbi:MAG: UDP-N-acetylmuramoyl-L-alanyl-D-glutamate--2,6-diaminopimelate ligase [Gammaproteobacteria bacterium]|nr:UDP-N-acetylmuramoyl-L-alanyl-D-glutamate--2,6-diaminopimelate ligase [Gammaproteobacteria bacterium]
MNTAKSMSQEMTLSLLLQGEVDIPETLDVVLTGIELDSRQIDAGDLFIACKGANFDGRDFVSDVIDKGAAAVLVEKGELWQEISQEKNVPIIPVEKLAFRLSKIAATFFDHPADKLNLIGITGTNGKTSICQFLAQCYTRLDHVCGTSGTLGYGVYGPEYKTLKDSPGTTPDSIAVQRIFSEMLKQQADTMVMEVSSHGLKQGRVCVNEFNTALFTNLTRDHLDYHGSMQAYGEEKLKLFTGKLLSKAIVNMDDLFSAVILKSLSRKVKSYTYSLSNQHADVYPEKIAFQRTGVVIDLVTPWGKGRLQPTLLGSFNVSNLLAVTTCVMATESEDGNFDFSSTLAAINEVSPVKGRMELIGDHPVSVVVDYAHTPDALKNALHALKEHYEGKIWCVFGCGGERDKGKRPMMAKVAEELANRLIVTDDNPRRESSSEIIQQIIGGFSDTKNVIVESDRATAIDYAVNHASEGDVVLIAGKGHEEYQDVGGNRMMFSDVKQARVSLSKRFTQAG